MSAANGSVVTGLDHATIATARLEETRDFFIRVLGLEEGWRPPFGVAGYWLYAGGRPILHLVPAGEAGRPAEGAIDHFSFAVDDMPAALARLDSEGVSYRHFPIPDTQGSQAFIHDPNGVLIEITHRP